LDARWNIRVTRKNLGQEKMWAASRVAAHFEILAVRVRTRVSI
jgi:hypothetical protein